VAQETGKVLHWLKAPGDRVAEGDPIVDIKADKMKVAPRHEA
jgi:pyruvate/2-oxoglutarate dehydrogenase complex dihydrolipoamide acyltransferase (E2) component